MRDERNPDRPPKQILPPGVLGPMFVAAVLLAISVWKLDLIGILVSLALLAFVGSLIVVGWRREWWVEEWWRKY